MQTKMLSADRLRNRDIGMVAVIREFSNFRNIHQVTFTGYDAHFGTPVEAKEFSTKAEAFAYATNNGFSLRD